MTTQKYKSLLVIIWALWAFHPCLAIDDVLRTAKRDAILAQITGAVRPKKQISAQLQISVAYFCSIGLYFLV